MTPHQTRTLAWMRRTRPQAHPDPARLIVLLEGVDGGAAAVIMPDGSYRTARLGEEHDAPKVAA